VGCALCPTVLAFFREYGLHRAVKNFSKEEAIHTTLIGLARRLGSGEKLPTVRMLCEKLSASRSTMDRVLRRLEAERIVNCIQGSGIYVSPLSNQRKIGIIFGGNINDPLRYSQFWGLLHAAVLRLAERNGDEVRTYFGCPASEDSDLEPTHYALSKDIDTGRLSGALVAGVSDLPQVEWLKSCRFPIVSFGGGSGVSGATVEIDEDESMALGLKSLFDSGCRKIAVVGFSAEADETSKIGKAYRRACENLGIPFDKNHMWTVRSLPAETHWNSLEEAGTEIIHHHWASQGEKPDGIYFTDDTMAHGGLIALLEAGMKIGKDVQVAALAHKGGSLLRPFWKNITLVEIDPDRIAEKMFSLLGTLLQGMKLQPQKAVVPPQVVRRRSR
jgi:DNA-binding LacI/PurR family transcriptional regulator